MSSRRLRGQETSIQISIDGKVQNSGTWLNVVEFSARQVGDIVDLNYYNQKTRKYDYIHHGFELSIKFEQEDDQAIDLMSEIVRREHSAEAHPEIIITALRQYRSGKRTMVAYHGITMQMTDDGFSGRSEGVSASFEAKAEFAKIIKQ